MTRLLRSLGTLALVVVLAACGGSSDSAMEEAEALLRGDDDASAHEDSSPPEPVESVTTTAPLPPTSASDGGAHAAASVTIPLRVESRVSDVPGAEFDAVVRSALQDTRGWAKAGFAFEFGDTAPYSVILAEPAEVDRLCAPYGTGGRYSCQNGDIVALNADRWRTAVTGWPGPLDTYRAMLVNHEVGHLLGQHHTERMCTGPGEPAAVMAQQSKGLGQCTANPWPLDWEVACASRHEEPLAPPYDPEAGPTCGPDDAP